MDLPSVNPSLRLRHGAFIACVNTLRNHGIMSCLDCLLSIITDGQSRFIVTLFQDGLRQLTLHTPFTFLWMEAEHLMDGLPVGAEYAIQFTAIADRAFQPIALAYLVLRFNEVYAEATANMVGITYRFTDGVLYGAFFYDDGLEWSYGRAIQGRTVSPMDDDTLWHGDYPVTFWNSSGIRAAAVDPQDHLETYFVNTRRLVRRTEPMDSTVRGPLPVWYMP